ncbi:MAG: ferritin-like domain-containing protein [Coprobacillaceae bacterium]
MKYYIDAPYPKIEEIVPNPIYGKMILDNVGGMHSEMSAISLYLYNQVIIGDMYDQVRTAFLQISMAEMRHLNIFCELSFKLGMDPRLWSGTDEYNEYWSPSYNNYPNQLDSLLENAIISEKRAIEKYTYQISVINDPKIISILERIILDEELHLQIFQSLYQQLITY